MLLNFDKISINAFTNLLECYDSKEFQSPMRSTVPLLSLLKDDTDVLPELFDYFGVSGNPEIHLEYTVPPRKGRGIASHTDAMLIDGESALAIEVKWTEPRYDTVEHWLQQGTNLLNRQAVMSGWVDLLKPYSNRLLTLENMSKAVYQMVHRAASACAVGRKPKLIYLQFTPLPNGAPVDTQHLNNDLRTLHDLLGSPANFPFYLVEMEVKPTTAYQTIANLPKKSVETAAQIMAALNGEPLFKFELKATHCIGGCPL